MKSYHTEFCDAALVDFGDEGGGVYHSIHDHEKDGEFMSIAAYEVVEKMFERWLTKPGALCCRLNIEEGLLDIFLKAPDHDDFIANFSVDVGDIFLSYAQISKEWYNDPPSQVSAILRKIADEVDAVEGSAE